MKSLHIKMFIKKFKNKYPEEWESFGCGPGGIGDWFVPDNILGVDISEACRIHDCDYRFGKGNTEEYRKEVDRIFMYNMVKLISEYKNYHWLLVNRLKIAKFYYIIVRKYGSESFFEERK